MERTLSIVFQGSHYLLFGNLESGGPIATKEQYERGQCSFGHLMPDGRVLRFREVVGCRGDIEVLGAQEVVLDVAPAFGGLLTDESWPTNGPYSAGLAALRLKLLADIFRLMPNVRIQRTAAGGVFVPAGENVDSPTDGPKTPAVAGPLQ